MGRIKNLWVFLGLLLFTVSICDFHVSADVIPSENECRPYIEKAIHELKNVEATASDDKDSTEAKLDDIDSIETEAAPETGTEDDENDSEEEAPGKSIEDDDNQSDADAPSQENETEENASNEETAEEKPAEDADSKEDDDSNEPNEGDEKSVEGADGDDDDSKEANAEDTESQEQPDADGDSKEEKSETDNDSKEGDSKEQQPEADGDSKEESDDGDAKDSDDDSKENEPEDGNDSKENDAEADDDNNDSTQTEETIESAEAANATAESEQANDGSNEESTENERSDSVEESDNQTAENDADSKEDDDEATTAEAVDDSKEDSKENDSQDTQNDTNEESVEEKVRAKRSIPEEADSTQSEEQQESAQNDDNDSQETANDSTDNDSQENTAEAKDDDDTTDSQEGESQEAAEDAENVEDTSEEEQDEDDLTIEFEIPKNLRPRGHVSDLLGLDAESSIKENALRRTGDVVLKDLKKVFDNAIKPLETMYKYRDLSNRHFGDPEIFSKPLILFMGPWSGGKSTILNYLTENEYTPNSIRSGAEPSPAYFNILMHGDEPEVLDGTQLAADWTFSGLQKFGQGLMDRLRGQKLPSKLLERVNIVEIPGILEVRKHVSRYFPFNDACQWFIDRADIIFLVYDPSKLDVGPETEAILDQLKGREYQTRILLNKADQVKPEELLRVQGALIWNISPLMSSAQPPVMYTVSLWSHPFESGSPIRLLQAQERAFLTDLREAIDRRIENKIASARRFAVRIRNHAKMVDCYLTTYYNQKGLFSNKKQVSDKIIEHPQNYNIYEGLSTLTNISRYDLPDPEVYLDFFRLNPLYEFKKLSETCTYFKGCPINKLDIAIAYELPELVGKYKKLQEQNLIQLRKEYDENCNQTEAELPVKIIKS